MVPVESCLLLRTTRRARRERRVPGGRRVHSRSCTSSRSVPQSTAVSPALDLWHVNPDRSLTAGPTLHDSIPQATRMVFDENWLEEGASALSRSRSNANPGGQLLQSLGLSSRSPTTLPFVFARCPCARRPTSRSPSHEGQVLLETGGTAQGGLPDRSNAPNRTAGGSIQGHLLHRFSEGRGHARRIFRRRWGEMRSLIDQASK